MATPNYRGAVQSLPSNGNGLLGRIGSYFGSGGTPMYRGAGQPAPAFAGGLLRPAAPAYVAAPVTELVVEDDAEAQAAAACEASACPIDPEALAAGHIAIVIPRGT
jgi:hypothetical protein